MTCLLQHYTHSCQRSSETGTGANFRRSQFLIHIGHYEADMTLSSSRGEDEKPGKQKDVLTFVTLQK